MERINTPELGAELLPTGSRIGSWRVVRCIGKGMYGTVYRVERVDPANPQPFALKLLNYQNDPRFEREVELLRRIRHGHVPRLHEVGRWKHGSGTLFPYFVMDWVQGAPLYPWAAARRVSSREVLRLISQVARALEATHAAGGVHRDVKGANVLVRAEDSAAVLVDFGAGTFKGAPPLTWHALPPGTPPYRSPEALRFHSRWHPESGPPYEATPADDLYALGVMAYRLVTGIYPPPPVQEEDNTPRWEPPEKLATVSPQLAALIKQLLSVEPSARGSARQVAEALERAARTAGKKADAPITVRSVQAAPVHQRWARALRPVLVRSAWLAAGAVAGMVLALWVTHPLLEANNPASNGEQADTEGNTVGLADKEILELAKEARPTEETVGIGLEMPKQPFPGQILAPCKDDLEEEIRGGCWVRLAKKPPCGKKSYEWVNGCYWPSLPAKHPNTSGKP
jgi:predicted Ser/Thr protein kinase